MKITFVFILEYRHFWCGILHIYMYIFTAVCAHILYFYQFVLIASFYLFHISLYLNSNKWI